LLQREQIDVPVSTDDLFLVETFILAAAKTVKTAKESAPLFRNDAADPKKLKQFGSDVSSSFLEELVRKTRKLLSAASVAFVREQAQSLQDRRLMRMCSDDFVVQFKTCWPCLPMFWTYKILLLSAQEKGIPIAIYVKFLAADQADRTVDEEWLYLMPPRPRADYEEQVPCPRDLSKAAVIVQGIARGNIKDLPEKSQWKAAVAARNIQAILAGAADHRQYPEEAEDKRITGLNDAEFVGYRQMALNEGYSLNNPSRFFIQHVYPAKVSSIPKLAQRAKEIGGV
jgi:hypothetical protein